jgi:hypothetical protein
MAGLPKASEQEFVRAMRAETERVMAGVMRAVNDAPEGAWINDSEVKVLDAMAELRRVALETALQMRVDAAEASSPPSRRRRAGQGA